MCEDTTGSLKSVDIESHCRPASVVAEPEPAKRPPQRTHLGRFRYILLWSRFHSNVSFSGCRFKTTLERILTVSIQTKPPCFHFMVAAIKVIYISLVHFLQRKLLRKTTTIPSNESVYSREGKKQERAKKLPMHELMSLYKGGQSEPDFSPQRPLRVSP